MPPAILARVREAGHRIFTNGAWNLNLVGVRTASRTANTFDDFIHAVFKDSSGGWVDLAFRATTDPGLYWRNEPPRVEGVAVLCAGQYPGAYTLGLHQGRYEALVQRAPVTVYRDDNRDDRLDLDPDTRESGHFGINVHRAGGDSSIVNRWSAGCQVIANAREFDVLLSVCRRSAEIWGDRFTYTLIED